MVSTLKRQCPQCKRPIEKWVIQIKMWRGNNGYPHERYNMSDLVAYIPPEDHWLIQTVRKTRIPDLLDNK